MQKILTAILSTIIILPSCGTAKGPVKQEKPPEKTYTAETGDTLVIFTNDHRQTRINADAVFIGWTEKNGMRKLLKSKRLVSISPRKGTATVVYDFRLVAGGTQRVRIKAPCVKSIKSKRK